MKGLPSSGAGGGGVEIVPSSFVCLFVSMRFPDQRFEP